LHSSTLVRWLDSLASHDGSHHDQDLQALLPTGATADLRAFSAWFPPVFATSYLELRLGADADAVDWLVALSEAECRRFLSALDAEHETPPGVGQRAWQRALEFCRRWTADDASSPRSFVSALLLQFDRPDVVDPRDPGVFMRLRRAPHRDEVVAAIAPLQPGHYARWHRAALSEALEALATHGKLIQFGTMARSLTPDARLHVTLPRTELRSTLRALFPREQLDERPELAILERGPDWLDLQLQVSEWLVPSIGIEASFRNQPESAVHYRSWLAPLVQQELCSEGKLEALLALTSSSEPAPRCELSHVKVTVAQGVAASVKAYVGLSEQNPS
jgi:hypothetical protein